MAKMTVEDLNRLRDESRAKADFRKQGYRGKVVVHTGTCGIAAGALPIMDTLTEALKSESLTDILVTTAGCAGLCSQEPLITVELKGQPPVKYTSLTADKVKEIVKEHIKAGQPVAKHAFVMGCENTY